MLRFIACIGLVFALAACERTAQLGGDQRAPGAVPEPIPRAPVATDEAPADEAPADEAAIGETPTATTGGSSCGGSCGEGGSCDEGGGSCGCKQIPARAPRNVPSTATWTSIEVQGMRCGGCAKKIEAAVATVEGVYDVRADHASGTVRVAAERDVRAHVTPRIAALGYRVQ